LDGNSGKLLVYSPRHKANFNLQYANSGGDGAGLFVKYVGERYDDATNLTLVPAYTVIDLKMWKEIKEWRFSFGIDNLLNEQYEDTLNYPLPRRRYTVSLKWQK
jgi:vitamin B12 transporter